MEQDRSPWLGRSLLALVWLALVLGPLGGTLGAAPAPVEPEGPLLRSLKIIGAKTVPKKKLLTEMTMPMPSLLPWKKHPVFKEEELEGDILRLKMYYQRQGFYHTEIDPRDRNQGRPGIGGACTSPKAPCPGGPGGGEGNPQPPPQWISPP